MHILAFPSAVWLLLSACTCDVFCFMLMSSSNKLMSCQPKATNVLIESNNRAAQGLVHDSRANSTPCCQQAFVVYANVSFCVTEQVPTVIAYPQIVVLEIVPDWHGYIAQTCGTTYCRLLMPKGFSSVHWQTSSYRRSRTKRGREAKPQLLGMPHWTNCCAKTTVQLSALLGHAHIVTRL